MSPRMILRILATALALAAPVAASAQTAQSLFSARSTPSPHGPHPVGQNARGCLAGGVQLPETGPTWQAMRLSRNHNWAHPAMLEFLQDLSRGATQVGWKGLYLGDISQPRGGPVPGHASHQIGLDADIWLLPATRLDLSRAQRESLSSMNVRASDQKNVNGNWTAAHHRIIEAAARDPRVNRIFITPPVKLRMCADAPARDREWLGKIRPWYGHNTHFHVRLNCPAGFAGCVEPRSGAARRRLRRRGLVGYRRPRATRPERARAEEKGAAPARRPAAAMRAGAERLTLRFAALAVLVTVSLAQAQARRWSKTPASSGNRATQISAASPASRFLTAARPSSRFPTAAIGRPAVSVARTAL